MSRPKRIVSWTLAALVLVGATTWATTAIRHHVLYGTVIGEDRKTLTVDRGDRFSIAVRDLGMSVGDHWTAQVDPPGTLGTFSERKVPDYWPARIGISGPNIGGGAGTRYFRYEAAGAGTATVTLSNCFQGCHVPSPYSRSVTWTITVR